MIDRQSIFCSGQYFGYTEKYYSEQSQKSIIYGEELGFSDLSIM